jgi:hypothetical protein
VHAIAPRLEPNRPTGAAVALLPGWSHLWAGLRDYRDGRLNVSSPDSARPLQPITPALGCGRSAV